MSAKYDALLKKIRIKDVGSGGGGAPTDAQYLTLALNSGLTAERVLAPRYSVPYSDGGANGEFKLGALVPLVAHAAAATGDNTVLYTDIPSYLSSHGISARSAVAYMINKAGTSKYFLAAYGVTLGTVTHVGMHATSNPANLTTWDAATSYFRTTATTEDAAYAQVDLGSVKSGILFLKCRLGGYSTGVTGYLKVKVSKDGSSWTELDSMSYTGTSGGYILRDYDVTDIRYVRLVIWMSSGGTYGFIGAGYASASMNKVFLFDGAAFDVQLPDFNAVGGGISIDSSAAAGSGARKAMITETNYGPSSTAPATTNLTYGVVVCAH